MAEAHAHLPDDHHNRSLSIPQEKNRLNILKITLFVLFIINLALSLFSWYTWKQTDSNTILAIILCCLITKLGCILGLLGSFRSLQDLKYQKLNNLAKSVTIGHNILIVSFYFLIMVLVAFLIFGTRALFYSDQSIVYLQAKYTSDFEEWMLRFGESPLSYIEKSALIMTNVVGYTCYIIVFLILIIIHLLMAIAMKYGIINSVASLIDLGIMILSWGIIYILTYAVAFKKQIEFEISINLIASTILLAGLLAVIAMLGYFIAVTEKVGYLKLYIALCIITSAVAVFNTNESRKVSKDIVEQLGSNCFDFMAMIDQSYIRTLGCGEKYVNVTQLNELTCDKGQQRYVWEHGEIYGCLNPICCESVIVESRAKFEYLGICSACSIVVLLISLWSCYYINKKAELNEDIFYPQQHLKILAALIILSVAWIYLMTFHMQPVPATVPYKRTNVVVNNAAFVDPRLLSEGFCIVLSPFTPQKEKCEECLKIEYVLQIEGKNVVRGENLDIKVENNQQFEATDSDYDNIKEVYLKVKLCPECFGDSWQVRVYMRQYLKSGEIEMVVLHEEKVASPVSNAKVKYFGVIATDEYSVDSSIEIKGHCMNLFTESKYKEYSFEVPAAVYNIPYSLDLTYASKQGPTHRVLQVGGLPSQSYTIEPTSLYSSSSRFKTTFSTVFLHAPPTNFSIEIRKGYNSFEGSFISAPESILLEGGVYSFKASALGFKSDTREVLINNATHVNFVLVFDKFEENELRIVLNWEGSVELDLRASFVMNKDIDCEVSYINKVCGGVRIVNITHRADEGFVEMKIRPVGAYQYVFYVVHEGHGEYSADVKVYAKGGNVPIARFPLGSRLMPSIPNKQSLNIWAGFCMDGSAGPSSLVGIKTYVSAADLNNLRSVCWNYYGKPIIYEPEEVFTVNAANIFYIPWNITKVN